jgi:single-stranded-DNA-specific exonuclease
MIQPLYRWQLPAAVSVDRATRDHAVARGVSLRLLALLVRRGVTAVADIDGFLAPPLEGLHDPRLLPDADAALRRVASARARSEKVMVYGDFDADGLTGLSILTIALRRLGLDVEPYVPERIGDGHGLSLRAVERAVAEGRSLIVTADCGTSSEAEIALAAARGVEVVVTDHHHAAIVPGSAVAVVNPQRLDGSYPERRLTGAGVAWKVAHLLLAGDATHPGSLPDPVAALADLALIGTVADVAPIFGENRSIARLGLDRLRTQPRPGLAALMEQAGVARDQLDLEDVAFALAPRLNAAGRVGEGARAARLLLTEDEEEARSLAIEIDAANRERRDMTRKAIAEARRSLGLVRPGEETEAPGVEALAAVEDPVGTDDVSGPPIPVPPRSAADLPAALLIRGEWPVGIVGLVAGRIAEDLARPAVVATTLDGADGILRASCRSGGAFNMAEALVAGPASANVSWR